MKITPVLIVEEIERSLAFWIDRMGFAKTAEVPEGDRLGFAILGRDGAELMLQTFESIRNDPPRCAPKAESNSVGLFVEVECFANILKRLEGYAIALPEGTTF